LACEDLVAFLEVGVEVPNVGREVVIQLFKILVEILVEYLSCGTLGFTYATTSNV